ncbi:MULTISPECIES: pyruvate, phosphate dikinase [unclassified Paenibacillus]|uniref:pyruvate, phosphate dikinase n=1 Tax=unclassified Paenibacillus TaxID=185978 RepID=UPI000930A7FA
MGQKFIYVFEEGRADMRALLGGKGANLAEMTRVGLPVPPGFTISTEACRAYFRQSDSFLVELLPELEDAVRRLELAKGQRFGDPLNPLLVSVRSGSVASMPGMMDTILNLGLNDETVEGLAAATGDPRFAYDCYRRLMQMFGHVVLGIESLRFEQALNRIKREAGVRHDHELPAAALIRLIEEYRSCYMRHAGREFPQDVQEQLRLSVEAVFRSWNNPRAQFYRRLNRIPDDQGTAVNVQSMVFGNKGTDCGTGVVFTRNPSTGEKALFGEYLLNAQGEDVVSGVRTPQPVAVLERELPEVFARLAQIAAELERHYRDMQDIEFTVEHGELYVLQTRSGKRNAQAALKVAVDLVGEGLITREEAIGRIEMAHLDQLLHRALDESEATDVLAAGLPASPGAAVGRLVFEAETAIEWSRSGTKVVLARQETTPEDIGGMSAAEGILTSRGGMTSHAAVVARGMGKPCVCGCEEIRVDTEARQLIAGSRTLAEGDWVTLDGTSGKVMAGVVPLKDAQMSPELAQMLRWADEIRTLQVYANADTPHDAKVARTWGAEGIGLCRTEHMFFASDRLPVVREMILAEDDAERAVALEKLLPMQREDFAGLFREMDGLPVTIRLLDPPLHEFLPHAAELQQQLAELAEGEERQRVKRLLRKVQALQEVNPMLGQRGCRLGIVFPDIYKMQIEAIFQAVSLVAADGVQAVPDIMIPLVGDASELRALRELVDQVAEQTLEGKRTQHPYKVGTMIEVPRAALTAGRIAAHADFFSFGTNDLTQMTFGYSRDDAEGKFLSHYVDRKLLPHNPFQVLDEEGVGQLVGMAVAAGRAVKPFLKNGLCGEHGGDKDSIFFCRRIGLDYVSCSPYRIPVARIAAAQAELAWGGSDAGLPSADAV